MDQNEITTCEVLETEKWVQRLSVLPADRLSGSILN